MKAQGQFSAANPGENEVYAFDFTNDLQPEEALSGITSWTIGTVSGSDPNANTRLSGAPDITDNLSNQRITGLLPNVVYVVAASVQTTFGNTLELWAFLPCYALGIPSNRN